MTATRRYNKRRRSRISFRFSFPGCPFARLVLCLQAIRVLRQATLLCRTQKRTHQLPVWGGVACTQERQYKGSSTEGIGRWKHLLPKEVPKKKYVKHQMQSITAATSTAYGTLNVNVSGYNMTTVEHYSQYIHNLCIWLGISVAESYALPTQTTEVMLMQERGAKMYVDSILKSHKRVIQLSSLEASMCPIMMNVLLKNLPEGVQLTVKEHTEADYQARFKSRPDLDSLLARIRQ
ncbi:39S ribosomal protein L48, mitochondrial isoform X2 [Nerophis ophidion]|uniref:39S ribosomal protein L48, mitochondrial isoform X2 n=1 Tax=Nerophis ophidion TaxID=159077 RepID=UPI002AE09B4E|nr:39S ribosomal protein L48, mitochondrial isoform X2 [Nerophis ophidion]